MTAIKVEEHEYEPVPGLPAEMPDDEFILWQGRPVARLVARRVLKTQWVAVYFALLAAWAVAAGVGDARSAGSIMFSVGVLAVLGALVIGLFELFAWGVEKTTLYTLTNCRLVMRIGVALSVTVNLPFSQISSAAVKRNDDGSGSVALKLLGEQRVAWLMIWPHARAWHYSQPEPSLICLADVDEVATLLAAELKEAAIKNGKDVDRSTDVKSSGDPAAPQGSVPEPALG